LYDHFDSVWEKTGEYGREDIFNKENLREAVNLAIQGSRQKYDTSFYEIRERLKKE